MLINSTPVSLHIWDTLSVTFVASHTHRGRLLTVFTDKKDLTLCKLIVYNCIGLNVDGTFTAIPPSAREDHSWQPRVALLH